MKVIIRADAGEHIGNGHIARCLTLAHALRNHDYEIHFITRTFTGNLINTIKKQGFFCHPLSTPASTTNPTKGKRYSEEHWLGVTLETEQQQVIEILTTLNNIMWVIVDNYSLDFRWHQAVRPYTQHILVIDDLANRKYDCDLLLDQNLYHLPKKRYEKCISKHCQLMLGPQYSLLRKQFSKQRKEQIQQKNLAQRTPNNLLVFMGGIDINNDTTFVLHQLVTLQQTKLNTRVIIGGNNPHRKEIEKQCALMDKVTLYIDAHNMAEHMAWAYVSIGSGGSTTWERCSLGLPTIAWSIANNQTELLEVAANAGFLFYLHDRTQLTAYLRVILDNTIMHQNMSSIATNICDGKGVTRVSLAISLFNLHIHIREVVIGDSENLHKWRNNQKIRFASTNNDLIELENHQQWFNDVLSDNNRHLLIGEINQQPIGVIRFDSVDNMTVEISIYLVPNEQGKGLGYPLLRAAEKWLQTTNPSIKTIQALINNGNNASKKLFKRSGYCNKTSHYKKQIG